MNPTCQFHQLSFRHQCREEGEHEIRYQTTDDSPVRVIYLCDEHMVEMCDMFEEDRKVRNLKAGLGIT
jgi:hypothetical protein